MSCEVLYRKIIFSTAFNTIFEIEPQNISELSSRTGLLLFIFVLTYSEVLEIVWFHDTYISTSTSAESQIDFDLAAPQLIPTAKPLQIITSKVSSTKTIKEGKWTSVHVVIESLKDHINSLENQLKDKQKILDGLFSLNSCQCSCNSTNRNHHEQKLAKC